MGEQMGYKWIQANIHKMRTGPHPKYTKVLGDKLDKYGYTRYMNVMNAAGENGLYGLIFH